MGIYSPEVRRRCRRRRPCPTSWLFVEELVQGLRHHRCWSLSAHTFCARLPSMRTALEQKAKYCTQAVQRRWVGAFGLTEPGAGTRRTGSAFAVLDGDHWVLNKPDASSPMPALPMSSSLFAVTGIIPDKKNPKRPARGDLRFHCRASGFSVGKHEKKMGIRGSPPAS